MLDTALGARILKVNHAGENGAVHIYAAQILVARWTAPGMLAELQEFKQHEERHRDIFLSELNRRSVPRCRSYLLCGWGGSMLGFITALFGQSAIAATTTAVEHVVLKHLKHQLDVLTVEGDERAVHAISEIIAEEQMHHDHSAMHIAHHKFWPALLTPAVAASTQMVIWLGMKL